jgi:hypothetical protein
LWTLPRRRCVRRLEPFGANIDFNELAEHGALMLINN